MIDTHCHLYDEKLGDPAAEVQQAAEAGVDRLVVIGTDDDTSRRAVELADHFAGVYATVGWHPNYSANYPGDLATIRELARHPKVVGLGEMGLDFHWDFATLEQQERCLRDQLALARELDLPIVFHAREATGALLDFLEPDPPSSFVMHCFSGTTQEAQRALEMGGFLGVDGPITYPKSVDLRNLVASTPRDRWLIETDAPYLAPVPHRGKVNHPAYVSLVCAAVAEAWGVSVAEAERITTANAERFYRLG